MYLWYLLYLVPILVPFSFLGVSSYFPTVKANISKFEKCTQGLCLSYNSSLTLTDVTEKAFSSYPCTYNIVRKYAGHTVEIFKVLVIDQLSRSICLVLHKSLTIQFEAEEPPGIIRVSIEGVLFVQSHGQKRFQYPKTFSLLQCPCFLFTFVSISLSATCLPTQLPTYQPSIYIPNNHLYIWSSVYNLYKFGNTTNWALSWIQDH